jgi:hypothetical protein
LLGHLRAEAAALKGLALTRLTQDYAAKIADVLQNAPPDQVIAQLDALAREHQQTKRAVMARMTSEAAAKRRGTLAALPLPRKPQAASEVFGRAAGATTQPGPSREPIRPTRGKRSVSAGGHFKR